MALNYTETTTIVATENRSVFFSCACPYVPYLLWNLNGKTFSWILLGITCVASPATVILNISVIIAVKRRKELQNPWTTLLLSLAIADLLVGAVSLPLSAAICLLIVHQVWLEHVCILDIFNVYSMYCLSMCSLYHLTAIAWDRYMAVAKWMDYKVIVSKTLVMKLAIIAWSFAIFLTVPALIMALLNVDVVISEKMYIIWCVCSAFALILIFSFYVMLYRGIRKRNISAISRVTSLVAAKLEANLAMTSAMLSGALVLSFLPAVVLFSLGTVFPVLQTSTYFLLWETFLKFNSLVNPLLYCCRDRRLRNAVLELLRIRKPPAKHPTFGAVKYARRRRNSLGACTVEGIPDIHNVVKPTRLLTRTESCGLAMVSDRGLGRCNGIKLEPSLSAPTLGANLAPSSILICRNHPRLSL